MTPTILVNGRPGQVDPRDRGLAYGDGLFETMACHDGEIRWLDRHLDRLLYGCRRLAIPTPDPDQLRAEIKASCPPSGSAVVKLTVTRGVGERGYRAPEPAFPTLVLVITSWPDHPSTHYTRGITLRTCASRAAENPQLAGLKHLCRLEQVLAQMELTGTAAQEGIMRSSSGLVVGGITSNVFVVSAGELVTPRIDRCGVKGVMRSVVLEHAHEVGLSPMERELELEGLLSSEEVFITNAVIGIKPVRAVDDREFRVGERTRRLMQLLNRAGHA